VATRSSPVQKSARRKAPAKAKLAIRVSPRIIKGLVKVFEKLADESRFKILLALADHGEMHVSALCAVLEQSQPAVSHHLALLLGAGLVDKRREGKHNFYCLDAEGVSSLLEQFFVDAGNAQKLLKFPAFSLAFRGK